MKSEIECININRRYLESTGIIGRGIGSGAKHISSATR